MFDANNEQNVYSKNSTYDCVKTYKYIPIQKKIWIFVYIYAAFILIVAAYFIIQGNLELAFYGPLFSLYLIEGLQWIYGNFDEKRIKHKCLVFDKFEKGECVSIFYSKYVYGNQPLLIVVDDKVVATIFRGNKLDLFINPKSKSLKFVLTYGVIEIDLIKEKGRKFYLYSAFKEWREQDYFVKTVESYDDLDNEKQYEKYRDVVHDMDYLIYICLIMFVISLITLIAIYVILKF